MRSFWKAMCVKWGYIGPLTEKSKPDAHSRLHQADYMSVLSFGVCFGWLVECVMMLFPN